jgi:ribonuclease HI
MEQEQPPQENGRRQAGGTVTGAGVYLPTGGTDGEELQVSINPHGVGVTHTNNRAELVAIAVALAKGAHQVATDSLVSLRLIRKAMYRPWHLQNHVHGDLLWHIIDLLQQHPAATIHLHKVKSHSGVVGNVLADACADRAANEVLHGDACDVNLEVGSTPFANKAWLRVSAAGNPQHHHKPEGFELRDTRQDLHQHMLAIHNTGASNTESIYYSQWQGLVGESDTTASNHFMTSKEVTHRQRSLLLRYRTGTLTTNKMLHRWDPTHTAMCPLCGQLDGGHHAMSACPVIAQTVAINRHHCAGRRILQALLAGARGGNLAMADVGNRDKMEADGLSAIEWALPAWLLNPQRVGHQRAEQIRRTMKPDAVLVLNGDQDPKPGQAPRGAAHPGAKHGGPRITPTTTIVLVELKYCRDTQPGLRHEEARAQHATLARELELMWDCTVKTVPIMLGVGGTMFTSTKAALEEIGIKDNVYTDLARDLNVTAAVFSEKAWNYRAIHASDKTNAGQHGKRWRPGNRKQ